MLDSMSQHLGGLGLARWDATRDATMAAAGDACWDATWDVTMAATWGAAGDAAWDVTMAAAWTSNEIQGSTTLKDRGQAFFFLPMFGIADPSELDVEPEAA
jgi:hypothetical protein